MDMIPASPVLSIRPMEGRKAPPSHYLLKIQSFSLLSKASVENYASEEFEAGGHKWSLCIYPTGDKKRDGQDHVSIYLTLLEISSLPVGWEVNAIVNFSVYNFIEDEYVITQDANVRSFHILKTEWGIPKFMDLDTFTDPSNGYLVDDTCVFGAEVFIVKAKDKGYCLSMIDAPVTHCYSWKFDNFSFADSEQYESEPFLGGNYKWNLRFFPNGSGDAKGNSISLFIVLDVSTLPPNTKLFVDYTVRARDQISGQHAQGKYHRMFSNTSSGWGVGRLVGLASFKDSTRGFLVDDSCILEAETSLRGYPIKLPDDIVRHSNFVLPTIPCVETSFVCKTHNCKPSYYTPSPSVLIANEAIAVDNTVFIDPKDRLHVAPKPQPDGNTTGSTGGIIEPPFEHTFPFSFLSCFC